MPFSEVMFNLDFFCRSSLMGTTLCAAPSKSHAFSTNYHACIAMPTWRRCAPPILLWPWPPYNLLPRSFLTFLRLSSLMGTTLLAALSKSYAFSTNYHAFIVDLDLHITSSRGCVLLGFSSSILTDGYHFAWSAQQKPCLLNKLSCMHCNANMM